MSKDLAEQYCEEYLNARQKASYTFLKEQQESKQNKDDIEHNK
jgi:hypothetical protein